MYICEAQISYKYLKSYVYNKCYIVYEYYVYRLYISVYMYQRVLFLFRSSIHWHYCAWWQLEFCAWELSGFEVPWFFVATCPRAQFRDDSYIYKCTPPSSRHIKFIVIFSLSIYVFFFYVPRFCSPLAFDNHALFSLFLTFFILINLFFSPYYYYYYFVFYLLGTWNIHKN